MTAEEIEFRAKVWVYHGHAAWHFTSLPKRLSARLRADYGAQSRGWNSLPVSVRVGDTQWNTSVFYDSKEKVYMLPLKASARKQAQIKFGQNVRFAIRIRV